MRLIHCACGTSDILPGAEHYALPAVPTRKDLRFLDDAAREALPADPTPSLAEIQAAPDVAHLGEPQFAPQQPDEALRVIVSGTDAALGAILTRLMRADTMWVEVAYIPSDPTSPAAVCWGLSSLNDVHSFALEAPVTPAACIRTDTGDVVAGSASIHRFGGREEFVGEIVVDSETLVFRDGSAPSARFHGQFGARLVPTMDAPGIACAPLTTPLISEGSPSRRSPAQLEWLASTPGLGWITRGKSVPAGQTDGSRVLSGRAVQTGGEQIAVRIDDQEKPRPVSRATFYRHLRDIQSVRNAQF
ncbi:hypothetical protein M5J20_05375 [Corynebacterium sp. TA-R-1]|uniref:Uncharacterized protein n=1 Tax=Corynebacterium stercoris TaxID=2943490 RepID=A0ABT1G3N0_9CORY|nr:hypothetical protein [Corynebacterium stercoris]MCP1387618.1 hypothetical protein [Corynebacterium stercoris]